MASKVAGKPIMHQISICAETAAEEGSGTDANVQCTLYDRLSGASETHTLDAQWVDDFRRASSHTYTVDSDLFGPTNGPVAIALHVDTSGYAPEWRVRDVVISSGGDNKGNDDGHHTKEHHWCIHFAVNGWVLPHRPRVAYAPSLAQTSVDEWPQPLKVLRRNEVDQRRAEMPWAHWSIGLPGSHAAATPERLAMDLRFLDGKSRDFNRAISAGIKDLALSIVLRAHTPWNSLGDYRDVLHWNERNTGVTRYVADHWSDDEEFGRQYLQGVAPTHLRRVDSVDELFQKIFFTAHGRKNRERVEYCLPRRQSLERAVNEHRLYVLDYSMLESVPMNASQGEQWYCPPARCLLYARRRNRSLIPVAIQLERDDDAPVWTSEDDTASDWLIAKTYLKCATANVHQILTHALQTHLITEGFAMATERALSLAHPISILLQPHMRYTVAINTRARGSLVGAGGLFDQFIAIGGSDQGHLQLAGRVHREQWSLLEWNDIEHWLSTRGLTSGALKDYCYRDDALLLWSAFRHYVADVLAATYPEGQAQLDTDEEMQAWIAELRRYAFRIDASERRDRVFGGDVNEQVTLDRLQRVLTAVLFTASAQHAAVNFCQFAQYGFVPNLPAHMRAAAPRTRRKERSLVGLLPQRVPTVKQVAISYALSQYEDNEVYLLDPHFNEPLRCIGASFERAFDRFHARLEEAERTIGERNDALEKAGKPPYPYLLPSRVPCSIAI